MPTNTRLIRERRRNQGVPLAAITREFWASVYGKLMKVHRLRPEVAKKAMTQYRRRVGIVALNQGDAKTALDIAFAVRKGGFAPIRHKAIKDESHPVFSIH